VFNSKFVSDKRGDREVSSQETINSFIDRFAKVIRVMRYGAYLCIAEERDSRWALSRILNLTVNANKYNNPLHTICHIQLSQKIRIKKAAINVQSMNNACFA